MSIQYIDVIGACDYARSHYCKFAQSMHTFKFCKQLRFFRQGDRPCGTIKRILPRFEYCV